MRSALFLLALLVAAARTDDALGQPEPGAEGQPEPAQTQGPPPEQPRDGGPDGTAQDNRGGQNAGPAAAPMSLDDARTNFSTVIEAFVAKRSEDGVWRFQEKSGRVRSLRLEKIEVAELKTAGKGRFSGPVRMRDVKDGAVLRMNFVVDFGGERWEVVGMTMRRPPASRRAGTP